MARRRRTTQRRRQRRSSFLPLVFRVIAILLIGGFIYYLTRDSTTRQEIADNVNAKIGQGTETVGNAAQATLTASNDVIDSAANSKAILVSNTANAVEAAKPKKSGWGWWGSGSSDSQTAKLPDNVVADNAIVNNAVANDVAKPDVSNGGNFIQPPTGERTVQQQGPAANQIFDTMMGVYANAKTYADNGKIRLDYRKQGLPKREVMNFSTVWDRARGTYRGELFETKVVCDGSLLTCYIYDVDTKNFGRQQLVIPVDNDRGAPPFGRLLSDDIARSFVGGSQDFPVADADLGSGRILLPPAMAMLSREIDSSWLNTTSTKVRLADEKVGSYDCYCIGLGVDSESKLYIEKATSLIRQIEFPKTLLDTRLLASPDVKEVRLYATFPDAEINRPLMDADFVVKAQPGATTVRKFIELAQTLPSDYLGKTIRDIELIDRNGEPFDASDLQGKITTIAWIGHEGWIPLVDQMSELKRSGYQDFQFEVAYPPTMLSPASQQIPRPIDELREKERLGIPLLLDAGSASNQLQLNEFPMLLVFDRNAKVQFVRSMKDKQWADELKTVLKRVADGEDISQEMLGGYLRHLEDYDVALRQVSADNLLRGDTVTAAKPVARRTPVRDTKVKLTPNKKWSQDSFAGPGNIVVLPRDAFGAASLAIFDGFQTLNFLNGNGQILRRAKLAIPENQGVSLIRISGGNRPVIAVFEKRGNQVHFFDQNLERITSFPKADEAHSGISDCLPMGVSGKFLLSFNDDHGIYEFNPTTGNAEAFSKTRASETSVFNGQPVGLVNGEVLGLGRGEVLIGNTAGELTALATVDGEDNHLVASVRTNADQWEAVSYDDNFKQRWSVPLTSQLFSNEVEPISGATTQAGETYWAFVDNGDAVCLISDRGTWLGDFKAESAIHGVALAVEGDRLDLIVSTSDKVVCWALNYQAK